MKLSKDNETYLTESIKRFFASELDEDIGDLKAMQVLEFVVREIAPSVYNQAISDAQTYLTEKVSDLSGTLFEPEFDYWKRR